jgi:hypothetical protein
MATEKSEIPCPFVDAKGKRCTGHIVRIRAFKADLSWIRQDDGSWRFSTSEPRSHYHLYCSEKENHSGWGRDDNAALKFYADKLPPELKQVIGNAPRDVPLLSPSCALAACAANIGDNHRPQRSGTTPSPPRTAGTAAANRIVALSLTGPAARRFGRVKADRAGNTTE